MTIPVLLDENWDPVRPVDERSINLPNGIEWPLQRGWRILCRSLVERGVVATPDTGDHWHGGRGFDIRRRAERRAWKATVAELNRKAGNGSLVMAGARITAENACLIIADTGVHEIHASLRTPVPAPMRHRDEKISFTQDKGREYQRLVVLEESVRILVAAADCPRRS